jgi:hypothetical protein
VGEEGGVRRACDGDVSKDCEGVGDYMKMNNFAATHTHGWCRSKV